MTPWDRRAVPTPALDAWRAELARGERSRTTFDPLFRAACEELNALEAPAELRPGYLTRARRIITAALKGRAA